MPFEINLPRCIDEYTLRCAGMEADAYHDRCEAAIADDAARFEVRLPYFLSDPPAPVARNRALAPRELARRGADGERCVACAHLRPQ